MDAPAKSDQTEKSWDHPWTTDEMRENRAEWNLAGDSGLLQHLQQFSDKLMTRANTTHKALNSLTSELDETIIFIDNITNTSLALANTQFIESRVLEDDIETELPQEQQPEVLKTKEQLDAELIASIGESVRCGIAIMDEKYETLEVVASDSEDDGEIPIPSIILRPKDPYQDRLLPYIIGSEKWKNSSKIGLESSSSESEHQGDDDSETDSDDNIPPVSKPINLHNPQIPGTDFSSSGSNDYNIINDVKRHTEDTGSNKNQDIFDSDSEATTAANSLPKSSSSAAPNFAEELAKRLGSVIPTQKSINTQIIGKPVLNHPKDDLFTPEEEDLFGARSENLFSEPTGLFGKEAPNSLWHDKPAKPFKSNVIPPSLDAPPPINNVSIKPKSAIDDLFGDGDSEDLDDIFSGQTSISKPLNQNSSPSSSLRPEERPRSDKLLVVGDIIRKEGMTTSTPETKDAINSLFDDDSEDVENIFSEEKNDWTGAKASGPEKKASSTPAEASDTNNRKGPVGGVSLLGNIDIFASGKLRRQVSSDSSSSKSSSDLESSRDTVPNATDDSNSGVNARSNYGNSVIEARNSETVESSGVSLRPPSIDVTANSNTSANFQPLLTSSWNRTGDMYRERFGSDSLFAAKTLDRDNENFLNNARIHEDTNTEANPSIFEDTDEIFGPPPLPKSGSKTDAKSTVRSLFDDSDTGDDLFSNTSSGLRSQKTTDVLSTTTIATSQSSDRAKIFKNRGLFDDDEEDENDIFGTKDSSDVNLFAASKSAVEIKRSEVMPEASSTQEKSARNAEDVDTVRESLDSNFEKRNKIKDQQTASVSAKVDSIFDDLDDDDLFSPSFGKKTTSGMKKSEPPSLFDDGTDDLFAAPAKPPAAKLEKTMESSTFLKSEETKASVIESGRKVGGQLSPKVMEQLAAKLDVAKTGDKGNVQSEKETKTEKTVEENTSPSKGEKTDVFPINKSKNLASKILDEMKTVQKSKLEPDAKPGIAKKPEVLRKSDRKLDAANKAAAIRKTIVSSKVTTESRSESIEETRVRCAEEFSSKSVRSERKVSSSDEERSSRSSKSEIFNAGEEKWPVSSSPEDSSNTNVRREPPKTLEIRSSTTSVTSEKSSAVQRRVVSGKIANLMGRMSDLKILSPTDTSPVWRKNEERTDDVGDKDSEDGSCISTSKESPTLSDDLHEVIAPPPPPSPPEQKGLEPAISFDVPVQVETLSVTASKSRVRIQSKRRPQSRRARQNALRKSGIDFDTVDFSNDNDSDTNRNLFSNSTNNNPAVAENSTNAQNMVNSNTDRLIISTGGGSENVSVKVTESTSSTFADDRSEISFSKESSLSINKNTLLSPSTDEEDLFDVPPDLPEDPPKEDALFGRAPILSPVESFVNVESEAKHEPYKSDKNNEGAKEETSVATSHSRTSATLVTKESSRSTESREKVTEKTTSIRDERSTGNSVHKEESAVGKMSENKLEDKSQQNRGKIEAEIRTRTNRIIAKQEVAEGSIDPLRDSSHDPIKDPSNLFAFVTKSPSPEKGKNLLFNEDDDSLFSRSSSSKKSKDAGIDEAGKSATKKPTLDLFADDADVDFFTTSLPKSSTIKSKESKIDLFGDDGNDVDDLFGGGAKKLTIKSSQNLMTKKTVTEIRSSSKKQSLFDDNSDETLFGSSNLYGTKEKSDGNSLGTASGIFSDADNAEIFNTGKPKSTESTSLTGKTNVEDIFGNRSGEEEDMFAEQKMVIKKSTIPSGLFGDDDDDGSDIFGKSTQSATVSHSKSTETRGVVKRATTRDLRKTAEQIVEDPLSMLQND